MVEIPVIQKSKRATQCGPSHDAVLVTQFPCLALLTASPNCHTAIA